MSQIQSEISDDIAHPLNTKDKADSSPLGQISSATDTKDHLLSTKDKLNEQPSEIDSHSPANLHSPVKKTPFSNLEMKDRIVKNCQNLISKRNEIMAKLSELKQQVQKHQITVRKSKTGSTVAGVIGTTLLFTPFAPFGAGILGISALSGLGTAINDVMKSKGYNKGIEQIVAEEEPFARELQADLKLLMAAAEKYAAETGVSLEEAYSKVITGVKHGNISLGSKTALQGHKWGELKGGLDFASKTLGKEGFGIATKAGATIMTKSLSFVGSAFDILDCVNSWKSSHPSATMIDDVVKDMEAGIRELELLTIIFS